MSKEPEVFSSMLKKGRMQLELLEGVHAVVFKTENYSIEFCVRQSNFGEWVIEARSGGLHGLIIKPQASNLIYLEEDK